MIIPATAVGPGQCVYICDSPHCETARVIHEDHEADLNGWYLGTSSDTDSGHIVEWHACCSDHIGMAVVGAFELAYRQERQ